jgi:hypothetical protein
VEQVARSRQQVAAMDQSTVEIDQKGLDVGNAFHRLCIHDAQGLAHSTGAFNRN